MKQTTQIKALLWRHRKAIYDCPHRLRAVWSKEFWTEDPDTGALERRSPSGKVIGHLPPGERTDRQLVTMRVAAGLTGYEVALMFGVHWNTIYRWERGEVRLSPELWQLYKPLLQRHFETV